MHIEVTREVMRQIEADAQAAHPAECCGILLGNRGRIDGIQPASNVHPEPETRFEIDPQALINAHRSARLGGPLVVGYYHSHPNGPSYPSKTDLEMAAGDGMIWLICGQIDGETSTGMWRTVEGGFVSLSYEVVEG